MSAEARPFEAAVRRFADSLKATYAISIAAQPEDQLKQPVRELLAEAGKTFGLAVDSRTEVVVAAIGGRPDVGVLVNGLLSGHLELKAPGKGARTDRFKTTDRMQWEKFRVLPNLIYTDGEEWALYQTGERIGRVVQLGPGLVTDGAEVLDPESAHRLADLLHDFLGWEPIVPKTPRALAETLAPLCHLLREEVLDSLAREGSPIRQVASEWRDVLFPDADDGQFADAYAQTITYTMLLARFEGEKSVQLDSAEQALRRRHGLLARALRLLSDPELRGEIRLGVDLLERSISAIDVAALTREGDDPWLYFYEDFLAKYDPKLRNDRGVYYTPVEVIRCQCRLVRELLRDRFGKGLDFADDDVVVLDPGAGTGAYLLAAFQMGRDRTAERQGPGAVPGRAYGCGLRS
jgi:N-6 DNA Methylase